MLNGLAENPKTAPIDNLPYPNPEHLRDCLISLLDAPGKPTKTVIRYFTGDLMYRTCKNGFFVGDQTGLLYYPLPDAAELEEKYHNWWKSAQTIGFR